MKYDTIKPHTQKKIQLIKNYVNNWLYVGCTSPNIETLNFIDTMCNASKYKCDTKSTAFEVFILFHEFASHNPSKTFNLFINDYDADKVNDLMEGSRKYSELDNLTINPSCLDVNDYLIQISGAKYNRFFSYKTLSILYVDPFDFGTVNLQRVLFFMNQRYTELIYNYMHNDVVRNIGNDHYPYKVASIHDALVGIDGFNEQLNAEQTMDLVSNTLRKTNGTRYAFTFDFRNKKNVTIYYLIFTTKNIAGLKKYKEALWSTFEGQEFFANPVSTEVKQMTLGDFLEDDCDYAERGIDKVKQAFSGRNFSLQQLEEYILEFTILKASHLKRLILKPLMKQGKIALVHKGDGSANELYYMEE